MAIEHAREELTRSRQLPVAIGEAEGLAPSRTKIWLWLLCSVLVQLIVVGGVIFLVVRHVWAGWVEQKATLPTNEVMAGPAQAPDNKSYAKLEDVLKKATDTSEKQNKELNDLSQKLGDATASFE